MMPQKTEVTHTIQKYILSQLLTRTHARFSDLRPPKTDTNLFTYHLKQLHQKNYIDKTNDGYTLGPRGMMYAEGMAEVTSPRICVAVVLQDGYGGTLLRKNQTQPFIGRWNLPSAWMSTSDSSLETVAHRALDDDVTFSSLTHAGDSYVRVQLGDEMITQLVHVFYATTDTIMPHKDEMIASPHQLASLSLVPGVSEVLARTFFRDPFFFEEFTVDW